MRRTLLSPILLDLGVITIAWVALALLANPTGEFPLNDDWSYSRSVHTLLSQGRLELTGFTAMPLLAQVLWGAMFCLPFGFSFMALRVSVWVLGLAGLAATYVLLRALSAPRGLILLAVLLLGVNPLYFALSLTFMTDVPFIALSVASLCYLSHGMQTGARLSLGIGFLLALLALLIRQLALAILIGFCLAYVAGHGVNRKTLILGSLPTVSALGVLGAYQLLLRLTTGLPRLYNRPYDPILESSPLNVFAIAAELLKRTGIELVYLGVFLLPLCVVVAATRWKHATTRRRLLGAGSGLAVFLVGTGWLLANAELMPLSGNVLYDVGVGPPLLRDTYVLALPHLPRAPQYFWLGVTAGGGVGAILLVYLALTTVRTLAWRPATVAVRRETIPIILATSAGSLYFGLATVTGFLDRYLIWMVPLGMVCVVAAARREWMAYRWMSHVCLGLVAGYGLFSVAATHDYFAWNRARWQALTYLDSVGVSSTEVDGGFEFNGWYDYDPNYRERAGVSWWWVLGDQYVVSFGPLKGYSETQRFGYDRWLPSGQGEVMILRKGPPSDELVAAEPG
jgi:hypothetical protein